MSAKSPWNTHTMLRIFHHHPILAAEMKIVGPLPPSFNVRLIAKAIIFWRDIIFQFRVLFVLSLNNIVIWGGNFVVRLQHKPHTFSRLCSSESALFLDLFLSNPNTKSSSIVP